MVAFLNSSVSTYIISLILPLSTQPPKPKIFTTWPFKKKCADSCFKEPWRQSQICFLILPGHHQSKYFFFSSPLPGHLPAPQTGKTHIEIRRPDWISLSALRLLCHLLHPGLILGLSVCSLPCWILLKPNHRVWVRLSQGWPMQRGSAGLICPRNKPWLTGHKRYKGASN